MLQSLSRTPHDPDCWMALGRLQEAQGELSEAMESYLQATSLEPDAPRSRTALGHLFRYLSMPEEAIHWHSEALSRQPHELILRLNHLFVLPTVASSTEQLMHLRGRCLDGLDALISDPPSWRYTNHQSTTHTFPLIYHDHNDRQALEAYGELISGLARNLVGEQWDWKPSPPDRTGRRKRIGFLSGFLSAHSNSLAFEGMIRHLDRSRFEVVVIHLYDSKQDETSARINSYADNVLRLSNKVSRSIRQLRDLELDLLYFTDIGMHFYATLLACARSAPIQITGWGIPQTSGLKTLDHYISSDLLEPEDAAEHYTEDLVRLPGLPSCYLSSNLPNPEHNRDYFFLPNEELLVGCLQNLWKLHPDFDPLLEQIAQQLPEAWFVLIEARISSYTQILIERLQKTAPTACERLILLGPQTRLDYISLAGCMDLLLDPPTFSSGVSLYDTIHTGTPTVCMEGRFLRSRHSQAVYRLIGVTDPPVARNPSHYVQHVVALALDAGRRGALRAEIRQKATRHLYDRLDGIRAFEAFALEAIERSDAAPRRP
ncbi:MAG: tetratricopeptide repeat protein [Cyanobium sp.]